MLTKPKKTVKSRSNHKTNLLLKIIIDRLKLITIETQPFPKLEAKGNTFQMDQFMMAHNFFSTPMTNTFLIFKNKLQVKAFNSLKSSHLRTELSIKVIFITI